MQSSKTAGDFWRDLPRPGVMCTIIRVSGHHPQEVGARMWVSREGQIGTLGGGEFERRVLAHALEIFLDDAPRPHIEEYVLCREMGQCCGGRAQVFYEHVPEPLAVHVFGGGHIGSALMQVLAGLALEPHVIDQRPHWSTERDWPSGVAVHCTAPLEYVAGHRFGPRDAVCIVTHSHDLDLALVRELLPQPLGYLGVIGSSHKARVFRARLAESSSDTDTDLVRRWDERVHCPMGRRLPTKNPKAIAISIATELLERWALAPRVSLAADERAPSETVSTTDETS
jgi:xanthine dehydrogenase accessory factor